MDSSETLHAVSKVKRGRFLSPVLQVALLVGVLVHLAGFLIFRVTSNSLPTREEKGPFVQFVSADSLAGDLALEEQALLYDSAPLFVPTKWNAAQQVSLIPSTRARESLPQFEPEMNLWDALRAYNLPIAEVDASMTPTEMLRSRHWLFFRDFAESGETVAAFPDVGHSAVVAEVASGEIALSIESRLVFTDTAAVPEPVRMYVRVSSGQLLSAPVISESSGNSVFDAAAVQWLLMAETIGQLPAGYLSVTVYP